MVFEPMQADDGLPLPHGVADVGQHFDDVAGGQRQQFVPFARLHKHHRRRDAALDAAEDAPQEQRQDGQPQPGQGHPLVRRIDLQPLVQRLRAGVVRKGPLPEDFALEQGRPKYPQRF